MIFNLEILDGMMDNINLRIDYHPMITIKDFDVLIIPTESEFVNHIKGRLSNIMFGRGWTLTRNIVDTIKKYPKKRLIILITSDKQIRLNYLKKGLLRVVKI